MSKTKFPAPPPPNISEIGHATIALEWGNIQSKLSEFLAESKIITEITMQSVRDVDKTKWRRVYVGFASNHVVDKLNSLADYKFRLRFKVKDDYSPWSEVTTVSTKDEPISSENIHKAVRSNNHEQLNKLLMENQISVEIPDGLGFTPLMVAAQRSLKEVMQVLLKRGADPRAQTESGKTALMLASFRGELEAIDVLLESTPDDIAKAQLASQQDRSGMTALHFAVDGESVRAVRRLGAVLVGHSGLDIADQVLLWTPLMRCAGLKNNGNMDLAKELIKLGADVNLADKEGNTALHNAVLNVHLNLCEMLLKSGADAHIANKRGHTPRKLSEISDNMSLRNLFQQL